mmetsp:Transcript_32024/g.57417  ORF Transcript_32024/g.57417 Transcript_32024/m.57417 type:complete len:200 (-) Transcript_32024:2449-3048(-)
MLDSSTSTCGRSRATPWATKASYSALLMPRFSSSSSSSLPASLASPSPSSRWRRFISRFTSRYCLRAFLSAFTSTSPPRQSRSAISATTGTTSPTRRSPPAIKARTAGAAGTRNREGNAPGQSSWKQQKSAGSLAQLCAKRAIADVCTAPLVFASRAKRNSRVPAAGRSAAMSSGTNSRKRSMRSRARSSAALRICLVT